MTAPARPSARCRTLLLELSRYLDGDLTPARRRTIERHIDACACCGTMAARLRRTVAACRAGAKRRPPRDVMARAAARSARWWRERGCPSLSPGAGTESRPIKRPRTMPRSVHLERHRTERIGWLRAAVLGANDGIVSTASLIVGVAAAKPGAARY